ncbi:MAG: thermonuclease family protein [Bdellovibrionales bacterium]|nr:thermonuclease family protein [Bdellovibrionales bacterium]
MTLSHFSKIVLFLVLAASSAVAQSGGHRRPSRPPMEECDASINKPNSKYKTKIVSLSDGDTVHVAASKPGLIRRIRMLNMDTPETHFMDMTQGKPGEIAAAHLASLLPVGTEVTIVYSDVPCDKYKRHLGFVMKGNQNVNFEMVKAGMALSLCFAPNLAQCEAFTNEAMAVMKSSTRFSLFKPFKGEEPAQVPHEFRYQVAGEGEAKYVGDMKTHKAMIYDRLMEIENPLMRVFFLTEKDVKDTGFELLP